MELILLIIILVIQVSFALIYWKNRNPNMEIVKKDLHILEQNIELLRSQIILINLRSSIDSNKIGIIEDFLAKSIGNKKSNTDYN